MNYALVENQIVTNLVWLHPANADEFPHAVPLEDIPAAIGDICVDGVFYRNGERVLSPVKEADQIMDNLMGGVNDVQQE